MATISRNPIAPQHEQITVHMTKEDYLPSFEKGLKQHTRTAQVPGFRKGQMPAGMARRMFGQSIFQEEVMRTAFRRLDEFLQQEKLAMLGSPLIQPDAENPQAINMNAPGDVTLNFEVGIRPELSNIPALSGNRTLKQYRIRVSDKMVDDEIERLTRRFGTVEDQDQVSHEESVLFLTTDPADGTGTPTGKPREQATVLLAALPAKLQEEFMGKEAGYATLVRPVDVATAEELPGFMKHVIQGDMATAEFLHELRLNKVGIRIPAMLDSALMMQVFPNDMITEEGPFREKLREAIRFELDRVANERLNHEIYETLVHETPILLPADYLKRSLRMGDGKNIRSQQQVERDYPGFEHNLRWQLILETLMQQNEGLRVTGAEIKDVMKGQVMGYFNLEAGDEEGEAPWLDSYLDKMLKDEKAVQETANRLMDYKMFSYLRSRFNIQEEEISEEEFVKLPQAHHHH